MQLDSTHVCGLHIVNVCESRIDASVALAFKEEMRVQTEGEADIVVLNLAKVQFVDSSGLGAIVASMKALGAGRKLALADLTPTVSRVFQLTRMSSVFDIFPDLDAAVETLGQ